MTAYYNENNLEAAAVLEAEIEDGVIAAGVVDTRSIKDVHPDDLKGFVQCHFFAGGGLWSVAARIAGWPDHRPIWTGSCPCQPFSTAGKGLGTDDPRHLWPYFHRLIGAGRPAVVMGEQVAGAPGYGWFDGVRSDLASENYASRSVDIPACAVDAPHQRNRLYWIAVEHAESIRRREGRAEPELRSWWPTPAGADAPGALDNHISHGQRHPGRTVRAGRESFDHADEQGSLANGISIGSEIQIAGRHTAVPRPLGNDDQGLHADANGGGRSGWAESQEREALLGAPVERNMLRNGSWWADAEWLNCQDGKARRTKPGLPLLVDGVPGRVDLWRVAGNAISPILAAEVISAFMESYP